MLFQVRCCGADGSDDYINALKPVPWECRDRTTGSEYAYGCQQSFAWYIEPWTAAIAGTLVTFLVIHVVQMILSLKLVRNIKEKNQEAYWVNRSRFKHFKRVHNLTCHEKSQSLFLESIMYKCIWYSKHNKWIFKYCKITDGILIFKIVPSIVIMVSILESYDIQNWKAN